MENQEQEIQQANLLTTNNVNTLDTLGLVNEIPQIKTDLETHKHEIANVNGLQEALDSKVGAHTHKISAVNDLQAALDSKAPTHDHPYSANDHTHNRADIGLPNVNNWIASSSVTDPSTTKYSTTAAVKTAYDKAVEASNAVTNHAHAIADVTGLQVALNSKAPTHDHPFSLATHKHTKSDISDFPTSLPANGGNSNTVGGKSPSDFVQSINGTAENIILGKYIYMDSYGGTHGDGRSRSYYRSVDSRLATDWADITLGQNYVYHAGRKPTPADIGLGNVNNWPASSSVNDASTNKYATTAAVKAVYDIAVAASNSSVIKSIRRGTTTITTGQFNAYTVSIPLSPAVDPDKTIVILDGSASATTSGTYLPYVHSLTATELILKCENNTSAKNISYQIVEFN